MSRGERTDPNTCLHVMHVYMHVQLVLKCYEFVAKTNYMGVWTKDN